MASRISIGQMNSSAVWLRAESPGPIFNEGKGMRAWSDSVGEPKGTLPMVRSRFTSGWSVLMPDGLSRVLRGVNVQVGAA